MGTGPSTTFTQLIRCHSRREFCALLICARQLADQNPRGHFVEWMLERPDVAPVWHRFINHPFVMAMGNGTLPLESFKGYLVQDYLYLVRFYLRVLHTH